MKNGPLTEGRVVHFVLDAGLSRGKHRAALVVAVPRDEAGAALEDEGGTCNLVVFLDGTNDFDDAFHRIHVGHLGAGVRVPTLVEWQTSRLYDAGAAEGTWHWPQDCPRPKPKEA